MSLHILCFGNLLQGDDGFGVHVFQRLSRVELGPDVRIFDAGLAGFGALTYFDGCSEAIVVDALEYAGQEGLVQRLSLCDLASPQSAFSEHAVDLHHVFHVLPLLFAPRQPPAVQIIGAQIRKPSGAFCMTLSAPVARAVEQTLAILRAELARWHHQRSRACLRSSDGPG